MAQNDKNLCGEVVERIWKLSERSIKESKRFAISLSGGTTPKGIYSLMASESYRHKFQWKFIHLFWGDERYVPFSDEKSNYRMVYDSLLAKVDIPKSNIHAISTDAEDPSSSAAFYEQDLISYFKLSRGELPRFDLILLGLGIDGHLASLFPQITTAAEKMSSQLVMATLGGEPNLPRVTLTLPVINNAKNLMWIVTGASKAEIIRKVLGSNSKNKNLLPKHVLLKDGQTFWFLDWDAAYLLFSSANHS
ncbi:MAG: 6-phosphogluconolactonase [Oligoflexia bacterium]|nr:6-phosphogluconolactonase [Oligoflexia bacterium]